MLAHATLPEALVDVPDNIHANALRDGASKTASENRRCAAHEFNHWLDYVGTGAGLEPEMREALGASALKFARRTLQARHCKLMKRGRRLANLDTQRRHRARIAAKKLRYATEFFASLYSRQRLRLYRAVLSILQDDLGWRNDVAVADGLLATLHTDHPKAAIGAGFVRGHLVARVAERGQHHCAQCHSVSGAGHIASAADGAPASLRFANLRSGGTPDAITCRRHSNNRRPMAFEYRDENVAARDVSPAKCMRPPVPSNDETGGPPCKGAFPA